MKLCASPASLRTQSNRNGLGVLKNYVATENKDMTLKSVEELFRKRHAELKDQPEFWKKCVEKVKRIEEDYRKSGISVDIQVEKLRVELHPDSLKLQLHDAIYRPRFYSKSLIHILSLSNSHNNVASIQKNRGDKSHRVIVA